MGTYVQKTNRRRYEDRSFSVRAVHRDRPDLHKLAEVLIRLTLQETGLTRAEHRAAELPDSYRPATGASVPTATAWTDRDARMNQASLAHRVGCCGPKPRRLTGNTNRDPPWV